MAEKSSRDEFKEFKVIWKAEVFPWALVLGTVNAADVVQRKQPEQPGFCGLLHGLRRILWLL